MEKQIDQLTVNDLEMYPVWEFYRTGDVQEGLLIQPLQSSTEEFKKRLESAMIFESFYVRTIYQTPGGRFFKGYSRISNHTHKYGIQPYDPKIIEEGKLVSFWYARHIPANDELIENYMTLRINPGDLFPLKFKIDAEIFHIENCGEIKGFTAVDDAMKEIILKVK